MKKIFLVFLLTFTAACATTSGSINSLKVSSSDYVDLESFCQKNNFKYTFDTLDEIVKIYSPGKEVKILLGSFVASYDGSIFYLKKPPIYSKGKIFIPHQLQEAISARKLVSFKPIINIKTIVIDPGHGGKDPGAVSPRGTREKNINLIIAKYLKAQLQAKGFDVILTRSGDTSLTLRQRVDCALKNNADLFVSIHANSNRSSKVTGSEIYYLIPSKVNSRERSIKLAKTENFQGKTMPLEVEAILWDLMISKNHTFSMELSNTLYFSFKDLGFKVRPPKKAPFYVLRYAYVPSVLVETGYLSNAYEEKALRKKHYQKQIAQAIALGISALQNRYTVAESSGYVNLK